MKIKWSGVDFHRGPWAFFCGNHGDRVRVALGADDSDYFNYLRWL